MNKKIVAVLALLATIATICYIANSDSSNNLRAWGKFATVLSGYTPKDVARHWLKDNYRVKMVMRFFFYATTRGHRTLTADDLTVW